MADQIKPTVTTTKRHLIKAKDKAMAYQAIALYCVGRQQLCQDAFEFPFTSYSERWNEKEEKK